MRRLMLSLALSLGLLAVVGLVAGQLSSPQANAVTGDGKLAGDGSNLTIVATGSNTPRSLADRAADWIEATDFGLAPNGSPEANSAALAAAIDRCRTIAHGSILHIARGYYRLASAVPTIDFDGLTIAGDGNATVLSTRSNVDSLFTWSRQGVRGQGGGLRDIWIDGAGGKLQWAVSLDSWRFWEIENVHATDLTMGLLDAFNDQNTYAENISVRHCDMIPASAETHVASQFGVRFRAGKVGSWTECSLRDNLFIGVWDTGVVLDGCARFTISQLAVANNQKTFRTVDGSTRSGVKHAVVITNNVSNNSTKDTGYHVVENIYFESHTGDETRDDNIAVLVTTPPQQQGFNRLNRIRDVAPTPAAALCIVRFENLGAKAGLTAQNSFEGARRSINHPAIIQVGEAVTDTTIDLPATSGRLWRLDDRGIRTFINRARDYPFSAARWTGGFPDNRPGVAQTDVGMFTRDTETGRVCWQDRDNVSVLIGPRPGLDIVSPFGPQRIRALPSPAAPYMTPDVKGEGSYTYLVVAIDQDGRRTPPGPAGTVANGPATLSESAAIDVRWPPVVGAVGYDLLKGDATHSIATGLTSAYFRDTGGPVGDYNPSTAQPPGNLTIEGAMKAASLEGDGKALRRLNASALDSGTVDPARLGSGTASAATFLRGDATFAVPPGIPRRLRSGLYYFVTPTSSTKTLNTLGQGTLRATPFWVSDPLRLTKLGAEVTEAGSPGSTYHLGIYGDDGTGYPGDLVLDAGAIAADRRAVQEMTIAQELPPGLYWIAGAVQGGGTTPPTLRCVGDFAGPMAADIGMTSPPGPGEAPAAYTMPGVTGPLPARFTTEVASDGSCPRLFVKVQ